MIFIRLNEADEDLDDTLEKLVKDPKLRKAVRRAFDLNASTAASVHFEAGIVCGYKLAKAIIARDKDVYDKFLRYFCECIT